MEIHPHLCLVAWGVVSTVCKELLICRQVLVPGVLLFMEVYRCVSGVEYGQHDLFTDTGSPPGQRGESCGLSGTHLLWCCRQYCQGLLH